MTATIVYFRDHGGQPVSTGIPCLNASTAIQRADLVNAVQIWSRGENDGADEQVAIEARVGIASANPDAQSGVYAYIVMKDDVTGRNYKERLPMPDLAMANDGDGDVAWLSEVDTAGNTISVANPLHANYAILKTAIEDAYASPNGNSGTLVKVYVPNNL